MIKYMKLQIKLTGKAKLPTYGTNQSAGADMVATSVTYDEDGDFLEYGTGVHLMIPEGYVGLIFPRSSQSKTDLFLANHVGVIDSDYRGEVKFRFKINADYIHANLSETGTMKVYNEATKAFYIPKIYEVGNKIGQLIIVPYPTLQFDQVEQLDETQRGVSGFGSTGA